MIIISASILWQQKVLDRKSSRLWQKVSAVGPIVSTACLNMLVIIDLAKTFSTRLKALKFELAPK